MPHELSSQDAFLLIYDACSDVMECIEQLEELLKRPARMPLSRKKIECRSGDRDWLQIRTWFKEFRRAMDSRLLVAIESTILHDIKGNLASLEDALPGKRRGLADFEAIETAVRKLSSAKEAIASCCDRMGVAAFGHWGNYWFKEVVAEDPDLPTTRTVILARSFSAAEILAAWQSRKRTESDQEWAEARESRDRWIYEKEMAGVSLPVLGYDLTSS